MSNLHIIWNPIAGNGAAVRAYAEVTGSLDARGIPFIEAKSEYAGHAIELTKKALASGAEKILVLGGDGTVREVAMALVGTTVPMGIVPCGTGNDMSRPLGIPKDVKKALETALTGTPRCMDAATANGELFFNIAAFGFDVDVLDYTEIYKKKTKNGSLAYLQGLLRAIAGFQNRKTTITWPGGEKTYNALLIAAGNGTHFGGGMMVTPKADPFDGELDFCIVHDATLMAFLTVLPGFLKGKHLGTKYVEYFRATELTASCEPASRLDIDGDVMPGTPVTFKILPKAVWVVCPASRDAAAGV